MQDQPHSAGFYRAQVEASAQAAQPLSNAAQAEGAWFLQIGDAQAAAVVGDFEDDFVTFLHQAHIHRGRPGVFADIGQGFLENPEKCQGRVVVRVEVVVGTKNVTGYAGTLGEVLALGFDGRGKAENP